MKRLKAGKYFVGDPCYVIPEDRWLEYLDLMKKSALYKETGGNQALFEMDGHQVWVASTMYGDGEYPGSDGYHYPVDAGLIGVTPIELCKLDQFTDECGRTIEVNGLGVDEEGGTIYIGSIAIPTEDYLED